MKTFQCESCFKVFSKKKHEMWQIVVTNRSPGGLAKGSAARRYCSVDCMRIGFVEFTKPTNPARS